MAQSFQTNRLTCVGSLLFIIAACAETADPANETPVDPEPGQYVITTSEALFKKSEPKQEPITLCLEQRDSASFGYTLAENYFLIHGLCTAQRAPRKGSMITGEIVCPVDPKLATGANRFAYKGAISSNSVKLEARMRIDADIKEGSETEVSEAQMRLAMKVFEKVKYIIEAKRIGDCA